MALLRRFSWQRSFNDFESPRRDSPHQVSSLTKRICLFGQTTPLGRDFHHPTHIASCVTPSVLTNQSRDRISNLLSISYASRPRLRSRLTLGGLTFPRNPWTYGECVSHTLCVTHAGILSSLQSTEPYRFDFSPQATLPYRFVLTYNPQASALCLAPGIFGATILDQ